MLAGLRGSPPMYRVIVIVLLMGTFNVVKEVSCTSIGEVIYAINAGGDAHTDIHGVRFESDPLFTMKPTTETIASDYGKQLLIGRVHPADMILYQTERYHDQSFGYDIEIRDNGDYVLVLKFCEVYFTASNMKVFDVVLNNVITVIKDLDIYDRVGRGVAHDEYIPFSVSSMSATRRTLRVGNHESELIDHRILRVKFIKGPLDNPKVNAIYVMKGRIEDVPKLVSLDVDDEFKNVDTTLSSEHDQDHDDGIIFSDEHQKTKDKNKVPNVPKRTPVRRPSGPRNPDPYGLDESSTMLPIFIVLVAFIPLLFCLCKL